MNIGLELRHNRVKHFHVLISLLVMDLMGGLILSKDLYFPPEG